MLDYNKAKEKFSRCKNPDRGYILAAHTTLQKDNLDFVICYHNTDVIRISPENIFTLKNENWFTPTTKKRINDYSPAYVWQKNKTWYIGHNEFFDGIQVNIEGKILNPMDYDNQIENEKKRKKLNKMISKYIKGFCDFTKSGQLEYPSGGDCWGCCMTSDDNDHPMGYGHILEHFSEKYYVPSLLANALKSKKYKNPGFIFKWIKDGGLSPAMDLRYYFRKIFPELLKLV